MQIAPVVHAAVSLWHGEEGPLSPVDCYSYFVPVVPPLIDSPDRDRYCWREELHEWSVTRLRGDGFLPLFRAVQSMIGDYLRDARMRELLGMSYSEED